MFTFLTPTSAGAKAAKRFFLNNDNKIDSDYITGAYFTSTNEEHTNLDTLFESLKHHAAQYDCLLKGNTTKPLINDRRKGSTDKTALTDWILLDLDGIPDIKDVDQFMAMVGLEDISYIYQYSSSMGVKPEKGLSAHIFVFLHEPQHPKLLKEWLKWLNFTYLQEHLALTASHHALSWPLDVSTCQNDKLLYIAPPICETGVKDTFEKPRFGIVKKSKDVLVIAFAPNMATLNDHANKTTINTLRSTMGLPKKSYTASFTSDNIPFMKGPDKAIISIAEVETDFVRVNLNNGDSNAYYHPITNCEILFNFKDEPNYRIKDLDSEYYAAAKEAADFAKKSEESAYERKTLGPVYLGVRDPTTDTYFTISYFPEDDIMVANPTKSKDRLNDFLQDRGREKLKVVPDWDVTYDMESSIQYDPDNRTINTFTLPARLKFIEHTADAPTHIHLLISHIVNGCQHTQELLLNWLAYIVQRKDSPRSAWLVHGTQGTGKGILFHSVMKPILEELSVIKPFTDFDDKFNSQLHKSLLVFVDETDLQSSTNASRIMQKFKNLITEKFISIRAMNTDYKEERNRASYMFFSNENVPLNLTEQDRRWHVAPRQETPLNQVIPDMEAFILAIEAEVDTFAQYLLSRPVNDSIARFPERSTAKRSIQTLATTTPELFAKHIKEGNLDFFIDLKPTSILGIHQQSILSTSPLQADFVELVDKIVATAKAGEEFFLPRDDLQTLYKYTTNDKDQKGNRFSHFMKKLNLSVDARGTINSKRVRGIRIIWCASQTELTKMKENIPCLDKSNMN